MLEEATEREGVLVLAVGTESSLRRVGGTGCGSREQAAAAATAETPRNPTPTYHLALAADLGLSCLDCPLGMLVTVQLGLGTGHPAAEIIVLEKIASGLLQHDLLAQLDARGRGK